MAFKKARRLWNDSGPGFIGLLAYVVRAKQQAPAHGLGPRPVPVLKVSIKLSKASKEQVRANLGFCFIIVEANI